MKLGVEVPLVALALLVPTAAPALAALNPAPAQEPGSGAVGLLMAIGAVIGVLYFIRRTSKDH